MITLLVTLALAAATPQSQSSMHPRDVRPPAREPTGIIRGRLTEQDTGQPVARATVTLTSSALRRAPGEGPVGTTTDEDGRYEFTALPAGDYIVTARPREFRPIYVPQTFGQDRPSISGRARGPRALKLADGEVREDVNFALWRAHALEGRVFDDFGEPLAGVSVRPRAADMGQPIPMLGPFDFTTDDRGAYRIYGLAPGTYTICATPRQFGPPSADMRERYVETCHPAAVSDGDAQPVAVIASDVVGVDIRLQRSRAYTVTGMAFDSSGRPLSQNQVNLERIERYGTSGTGLQLRQDGTFTARGLTPGDYVIRADTRPRFGPPDATPADPERELAYVPFRIDGSDIEGLAVVTQRPTTVSGRVVLRADEGNATEGATAMRVTASSLDPAGRMMMGPPQSAPVRLDRTFELGGLFGPAVITLSGGPPNWIVESIRYRGRDITDIPIDFAGAREGDRVDITLTNGGARLSGTVVDDSGQATEALIWILPADSVRWAVQSVLRRGSPSDSEGGFRIGPLRPGDYLIVALDPEDAPRGLPDPKYFERVAAMAERITLSELDEQIVQLQLRRLQ